MSEHFLLLLADAVLVVHFAFVAFVVVGLIAVWVGYWRGWSWVRNLTFRTVHLLAMGVVVAESVFGITCPLTTWENALRWEAGGGARYATSFVQHWIHRVLYYEVPAGFFTTAYIAFFCLLLGSLLLVPPRWTRKRTDHSDAPKTHRNPRP